MILFLARHGLTDWNDAGRYLGHSDPLLNATGQQQVECLAHRLSTEHFDAIHSSDLQRSVVTATHIASVHGLSVQHDSRLREMNFGLFEGLTYAEIQAEYPAMSAAWFDDPEYPPIQGERLSEMNARVISALADIRTRHVDQRVLIVAHGGSLRLILCHLLGLPFTHYWRFDLQSCAVTQINVYDAGGILMRLNESGHLREITS